VKEKELQESLASLGSSEKSLIQEYYLSNLERWAKLIDEINNYVEILESLPSNLSSTFRQCVEQFDNLVGHVRGLNIGQNANSAEQLKNQVQNYQNQYYVHLLETKQLVQAAASETNDISALRKVVTEARKERKDFEKSFSDSLQKQAEGSQRTLAQHFTARLKDLQKNGQTSPGKWLEKRTFWGWVLAITAAALVICYILLIHYDWIQGYELQIGLLKLAILAFIYTQYHFATKNYYIYADMVAKYEHLTVISKTMTDFIAAAFDDEVLKESVLSNASKTLFSEINTGHTKNDNRESSVFENIINQLPGRINQ
jgi:hypothetical protein